MSREILIVDDNSHIRNAVRYILESGLGACSCTEANNGRDALEKACDCVPDVIVLDRWMPDGDAVEIARTIKLAMPNVRIVLFTMDVYVVQYSPASLGVDAIVQKPDGVGLLRSVQELLSHA